MKIFGRNNPDGEDPEKTSKFDINKYSKEGYLAYRKGLVTKPLPKIYTLSN